MKIKTIKSLTDKIRKHTKYEPPQPRNQDLPPTYNIVLSASPKGGGKTYNTIQLLTNYEDSGFVAQDGTDVRMRTIWISGGTSRSKQNSILDTLKTLDDEDRIDLEDDVDEYMRILYEDIKQERDEIDAYNIYRKVYDKYMKSKTLSNLTMEELTLLRWKDFIDPKVDPDAPRDNEGNLLYNPRMVFLVLDDMIGSDGYGTARRNFINRLSIKSRHESEELVGLNLIFITQSFKAVPAIIRKQTDLFVLLKSASRLYIIDAIAEEVGSHFSKDEILSYYDEIMKIPYGSLILSIHKKEKDDNRVRMGWTQSIQREQKYLS
jgi:hypothetical protein